MATQQSGLWQTKYTDRDDLDTLYRFDDLGRFLERILPGDVLFTLTYDSDGNLTSLTDSEGLTLSATWGPGATLESVTLPAVGSEG